MGLSTFTGIFTCETQDRSQGTQSKQEGGICLSTRVRGGRAAFLLYIYSACPFFNTFTIVSLAESQINTLLLGILSFDILTPTIDDTK